MYCPECGGEYREGFTECADCGGALVENLPKPQAHPDFELVTVLNHPDPAVIALAESLLIDAGIPYTKKNDFVQDLLGAGRFATPVHLQVSQERAEAALEILERIEADEPSV